MLGEIKTPTVAELFVGDLAAIGNWVVANVRSSVAWPLQVEVVDFRGHRILSLRAQPPRWWQTSRRLRWHCQENRLLDRRGSA